MFKPPQVDKILKEPIFKPWHNQVAASIISAIVREIIDDLKAQTNQSLSPSDLSTNLSASQIAQLAVVELKALFDNHLSPVINGTGIIINTNLGRAPLPASACQSAFEIMTSYCDLELDLATGKRGDRLFHVERLLKLITGYQAALVVNNNAAAVMLAIAALAPGKEVIVSRGELVEIGGSFRLPDVIASAGGKLQEVGTTNRTRVSDYQKAISANSGMIFKCHQSNFEIKGYVEEASLAELAPLAQANALPLVEDLGTGALLNLEKFGLPPQKTVPDCLATGADLVMFSADKLLGGPQAGVILASRPLIDILKKHPIYRALRADKLLICLLENVLKEYLRPHPEETVPVLAMANQSPTQIKQRVQNFIEKAASTCQNLDLECIACESAFGGGTTAGQRQPSFGISLKLKGTANLKVERLAKRLRMATPPVIARLNDERLIIDFRTVQMAQEAALLTVIQSVDGHAQQQLA